MDDGDSERAMRLYRRASNDPTAVDVEEIVSLLDTTDEAGRQRALAALAKVAKVRSDAVCEHLEVIQDALITGPAKTSEWASLVLQILARHRPEEVLPLAADLRGLLHDLTADVDERDLFSGTDEIPHNSLSAIPEVIKTLALLNEREPGTLGPAADDLKRLLRVRDVDVQMAAAMGFVYLSKTRPQEALLATAELDKCLEPTTAVADPEINAWLGREGDADPVQVRAAAANALNFIAKEHPGEVRDSVERLAACVDADDVDVKARGTSALCHIAGEYPGAVSPFVANLDRALDHPDERVSGRAALTLAQIAFEHPQAVAPSVDTLRDLVAKDNTFVQTNASWALNVLSKQDPGPVRPAVSELVTLLDSDETLIRENAIYTLYRVGHDHPSHVQPHAAAITQRLGDSSAEARRNATDVLVTLGADRAGHLAHAIAEIE